MATLGLNEEKMRRLAKTYDKDAKKLRDVGKDIERKLKTLDGQGWWGDDARRFADQWRDLQAGLGLGRFAPEFSGMDHRPAGELGSVATRQESVVEHERISNRAQPREGQAARRAVPRGLEEAQRSC